MAQFKADERRMLTEVYRRLNYLKNGDLDTQLLLPAYPSEAKPLITLGIITPTDNEVKRVINWYKLTNKGKMFFSHYNKEKITEFENFELFEGRRVVDFDFSLLS